MLVAASGRETKKLADKERQLAEKAFRAKEDALREDDNVFDVSFEGQGEIMTTVSATDVKVRTRVQTTCWWQWELERGERRWLCLWAKQEGEGDEKVRWCMCLECAVQLVGVRT